MILKIEQVGTVVAINIGVYTKNQENEQGVKTIWLISILTLLPPLVIIVFALVTRGPSKLLLGAVIGFFMTDTWNVIGATLDGFMSMRRKHMDDTGIRSAGWDLPSCCSVRRERLDLVSSSESSPNPKNPTLILGWILGIIVFMDDYLNILTISASLRERHVTNISLKRNAGLRHRLHGSSCMCVDTAVDMGCILRRSSR